MGVLGGSCRIAANLGDVEADLLGKLWLREAALLAELGQVFGEAHCSVVVNRHDYTLNKARSKFLTEGFG